ncbi:MAG: competence/damage-inducible protein A [Gemmatimonadota bacterium]
MHLELLTIGTELLLGFTVDTNSAFMGQRLGEIGVTVSRRTSIGDDPVAIRAALIDALARSRFVITTGGLGPTRDDMTKKVVAELFNAPLEFHDDLAQALIARFAKFGRVPAPSNRCQSEVPKGALVLPNKRGTAPGLWLSGPLGEVIMLPGVPVEMRGLITDEVIPRLRERSASVITKSLVLRTTSIPESSLADRLSAVEDGLAPLTLAYLPGVEGVDLRLTAWSVAGDDADRLLEDAGRRVREVVGDFCYGTGEQDLAALLLDELRERHLWLAVAESCTGGMIGERITAVPGSSEVFSGGVIAYADAVKQSALDVPSESLREHGAVSEAVVRAMAEGVARKTGADVSIAITGVAGPGGGSSEKPVGTVWVGFSVLGEVTAQRIGLPGNRYEVRARASQFALHGLLRRLRQV